MRGHSPGNRFKIVSLGCVTMYIEGIEASFLPLWLSHYNRRTVIHFWLLSDNLLQMSEVYINVFLDL